MKLDFNKKIYGYDELFNFFIKLDDNKKIPNKFIISGKKGIGKSTFAYHLINYLFSKNEKNKYDINNFEVNEDNKSFKLVSNFTHPNFYLIDAIDGKESISIETIRKSFNFINKSSINNDYRIILIDNMEYLNLNSSNALLKIIEEPNDKLIFILIHNSSYKLLDTINSRCIIFKKNITTHDTISIFEKLTDTPYKNVFNDDLLVKFMNVEDLLFLKNLSEENNLQEKICINSLIMFFFNTQKNKIEKKYHKIVVKLIQLYLYKKNLNYFDENIYFWYKSFFTKLSNVKKYNLDIGNLFFEFRLNVFNE